MADEFRADAFVGYHLRVIEDTLRRIEESVRGLQARQGDLEWLVERVEKKIDALGSTTPQIKEAIAQINVDTARVKSASAAVADVTTQLDKTGAEDGTKP